MAKEFPQSFQGLSIYTYSHNNNITIIEMLIYVYKTNPVLGILLGTVCWVD